MDYLKEWIVSNSGFINEHLVRLNKNGLFGIYAKKNIEKNTILIKIPKKLFQFHDSLALFDLKDDHFKITKDILLKKYEDNKTIFKLMPTLDDFKKYDSHFLSTDELNILKSFPNIYSLLKYRRNLFNKLINELNSEYKEDDIIEAIILKENYAWMEGLVPYLGLFNHKFFNKTKFEDDEKYKHLISTDKIKKDEEIFVTYSPSSVLEFAVHYNFYDEKNTHVVKIWNIGFNVNTPIDFYKAKELIDKNILFKMSNKSILCTFDIDNPFILFENFIPKQTLDFLKILAKSEDTLGKSTDEKQIEINIFIKLREIILYELEQNNYKSIKELSYYPKTIHRFIKALKKTYEILLKYLNVCTNRINM